MVDKQPHGGQKATWWTNNHMVDKQPHGGEQNFRDSKKKKKKAQVPEEVFFTSDQHPKERQEPGL